METSIHVLDLEDKGFGGNQNLKATKSVNQLRQICVGKMSTFTGSFTIGEPSRRSIPIPTSSLEDGLREA